MQQPRGPTAIERRGLQDLKKPLLIAGGVAAVLALGVGGYMMMPRGGETDAPAARGVVAPTPRADDAPAAERDPKVLQRMAADTPKDLRAAMEMSEAVGDRVGQAEAALLLHLRYGPDPVLAGQAGKLLEPYATQKDPFVTRVRALADLAAGDVEGAAAKLAGDGPRLALYRGWVALQAGDLDAASREAAKAREADARDMGAVWLAHAARVRSLGAEALPALREEVSRTPGHPRLSLLLAEALADDGDLREAAKVAASIDTDGAPAGFQARVLELRGRIAATRGDRTEALLRFDQARELAPEDLTAALGRVRVLMDAEDYATAAKELDTLRLAHPKDLPILLVAAELAMRKGRGDDALEVLEEAVALAPEDPRVLLAQGQVYAMRMDGEKARPLLEQARNLDPTLVRATEEEAGTLARLKKWDEVYKLLDAHRRQAEKLPGGKKIVAELWLVQARFLEQEGQTQAALAALDKALDAMPGQLDARLVRGRLRLAVGDEAGGAEDLQDLFDRTGGYPGLAGPLGRLLIRRGDVKSLDALIGEHLEDPRAPTDVILVGARLRLAQGNREAAVHLVDRVLERDPNNWEAHLVRGQVLLAQGDAMGALGELQQARPRKPDAELQVWLGKAFEATGETDTARAHYARAVELAPDMIEARVAYGALLAERGAAKAALEQLGPALEGDAHPRAQLAAGMAYRDLGQFDKAARAFRKASKLDPSLREASFWEGRLYAERNKNKAAVGALSRAVQGAPDDAPWLPLAYRLLGRAHAENGQRALARKAYERFLQLAPPSDPGRAEAERRLRDL